MTGSPAFVPSCLRVNDLLEQHFNTAFAAPDGIKKLRELILTLAMQGKLVPQDPNDPPASELLKEIEKEKLTRRHEDTKGKGAKLKQLPPIKPEEVPYELPRGWVWVRVGDICHDWGQKTPENQFTYIDVGTIDNKLGTIGPNLQVLEGADAPSRARKIVKLRTVIYSTVRPYLLNIAIIEKEYDPEPIASTAFAVLHPYKALTARFIYHYLRSPAFVRHVESTQKGVAYPAINDGDFFGGLFPLPPLPEQHRIVAKIDQVMARCDELEQLRAQREQMRINVHTAAIKQLLDPSFASSRLRVSQATSNLRGFVPSCEAFDFLSRHFGELYTVKENVAELRKAILQLAVMGKLVPQNPNDPPARELLEEIEKEKLTRRHEDTKGRGAKAKKLPPIKPEEVPYELPQGWEWARLQDVLDVRDGTHDSPKDAIGSNTYPLVTSKNFSNGRIDFSGARRISSQDHFEISKRSKVERLDILFSMIGGNIGNQVIVQENCEFSIKNVALFKYYSKELTYPYFIKRFMENLAVDLQQKAIGGAQPFVSLGLLRNIFIGLPPLPEQHRIVAKIDQLMALCDTLERQIDAASTKQTDLLNAVMAKAQPC